MGSIPAGDDAFSTPINLQRGWPSPSLFAAGALLEGATEVLSSKDNVAQALIYGPHTGHPPLRESLASWLSTVYGRKIEPYRLCVHGGASPNLGNVVAKFTDPTYTRKVFMVEPTYFLACPILEDNGLQGKLRGVPEGEHGVDTEFLRREMAAAETAAMNDAGTNGYDDVPRLKTGPSYPKIYKYIIYTVPTFSNPSGRTMRLKEREELVRLARQYDALIISDDVYDFPRWPEDPARDARAVPTLPPRLVDVDQEMEGCSKWGNALSNGSFAKIIGPGIRQGWADCSPALAQELGDIGLANSGGNPAHIIATFVDKMLRSGHIQTHVNDVLIPTYRARRAVMVEAIDKFLVPLGVKIESVPQNGVVGGFFVYLRLPKDVENGKTVAGVAQYKKKLRIAYGHMFAVSRDKNSLERAMAPGGFAHCIRLCWAWHEEDIICQGIERLAEAIHEVKAMKKRGESFEPYLNIGVR